MQAWSSDDKLTLRCGVYGEAAVFSVEIDRHARVEALQHAIRQHHYSHRSFPAHALRLRVARKANEWMPDNEIGHAHLRGAVDTTLKMLFPSRKLSDDQYFGQKFQPPDGAIHVLVESPHASVDKQQRYKELSTEASCRKFLDAVAQAIQVLYKFDTYYELATIGDVLFAKRTNQWSIRQKNGEPTTTKTLPDFFSTEEWSALDALNAETTRRIHNGRVPTSRTDMSSIIALHNLHNESGVNMYNDIATKASLVATRGEFGCGR